MIEFGIEYEMCIFIDDVCQNSINKNINNDDDTWMYYTQQYLSKISDNILTTNNTELLNWCASFNNIITIGKLKDGYRSKDKVFEYYIYDIFSYNLQYANSDIFNKCNIIRI